MSQGLVSQLWVKDLWVNSESRTFESTVSQGLLSQQWVKDLWVKDLWVNCESRTCESRTHESTVSQGLVSQLWVKDSWVNSESRTCCSRGSQCSILPASPPMLVLSSFVLSGTHRCSSSAPEETTSNSVAQEEDQLAIYKARRIWSVSDYLFLAPAYMGSSPDLSVTVSSSLRQSVCALYPSI